uniref:beta-N-acetylhexosaminidase n=1 Tax=Glossina pallidipes TaxID=7398 RepID=A0A1B0AF57_GLOPL
MKVMAISSLKCEVNSPRNYCIEPPCEQLDPTANGIFRILRDIYKEMFGLFDADVFHMGGLNVLLETIQIHKQQLDECDGLAAASISFIDVDKLVAPLLTGEATSSALSLLNCSTASLKGSTNT